MTVHLDPPAKLARMAEVEKEFAHIVLSPFAAQGRSVIDTPDLNDEADIVVVLAGSVLRFAFPQMINNPSAEHMQDTFRPATRLLRRITETDPT